MSINVRSKGQNGEREVANKLNEVIAEVRAELGIPCYASSDELFQRNQNQSAVGGSDLSNPLGLDIEVKRQETLSLNSWWKQCVASANRGDQETIPILIWRQNRKPWNVMMEVDLVISSVPYRVLKSPATITIDAFLDWFRWYYRAKLESGNA